MGNAIKLSGRTFLAPHRGSSPKGLCKRTGFLGVKRRENPVRCHFERSEMRGLRETVLLHSGKPPPPRFARLPLPEEGARMIFKETLIQSLSFAVWDSRSPTYAARLSAFLICLSYRLCPIRPFGAPSPRGEGWRYEENLRSTDLRASPHIFAAKPPPSFLIPHSSFLIQIPSPLKIFS